ncbi:TPA: hypothetical protein PPD39_000727 [Acinetobacter baumannii]|uniref:hypothetical protein n=1 Tax=Acinetobacter baumannii TaxID=470 RepID=UPI00070727FF|nr:hypothetical protein [Acinetobacter baumannii]KQE43760.1 hypothetical protein APD45_06670 [Acinetobacter baumannii]MCA4383192.1 hypothetical protein [Acinetobacter baumannii]MCX3053366.1 hypothetical protein [Acinetobacter baumannii]NDY14479.1 hypothetical protein [Acinetobacter baumannii]QJF31582.1 hypothetical protein HIN87_09840 [Acinetobacter baumannii]
MQIEKIESTKRRDQIDTLRTTIWYSYIEMNFTNSTNYKIEKLIEPESFRKSEAGNYFHSNKWTKYKIGKHTPGNKLINKANQHVKGTAKIINHIVWEAIRGRKSLKWFMEDGVNQLSWDVQRIIFKTINDQNELISVLHIRKDLRRLERLANLDALAALIFFLRIADDQNQRKIALSIGHSIYRILLVMCVFLPLAKFRYELAFLIYLYVFPLCQSEMKKNNCNDVNEFYDNSTKLNYILLEAEDENIIDLERKGITKKMYTNFLFDILDGKRGLKLIKEFSPSF